MEKIKSYIISKGFSKQEFEYAGVEGIAFVWGWQLVVFYEHENDPQVSAVSIHEFIGNDQPYLLDTANELVSILGFDLKFGEYVDLNRWGNPVAKDEIKIFDTYYFMADKHLLSIGVTDKNELCEFEIILNPKIIQTRWEYLNEL